ncbi:MAG: GNAT family N-acetyltransferase [Chloroflexota bacterium]
MPPSILGPAYRVETARMVLRCWNPPDATRLKEAVDASLDHLLPWMPWAKHEPTDLQTKIDLIRKWRGGFDLGEDFVYGVFDRAERRVLGGTGLHTRLGSRVREIGYWIRVDAIGQGLATELSAALTRVAFEIDNVQRVEIHCDARNVRSAAVPEKLGYTLDATLRQRTLDVDGNPRDTMIWSLLALEYPSSPASAAAIKAYDAAGRPLLS